MRLIIAGGRDLYISPKDILNKLEDLDIAKEITEIVSGNCSGIDKCGENFALLYNIPIKYFKADWEKYSKSAGPIRNKQMADYADILLLIWNGHSKGSNNMKNEMKKLKKITYQIVL